MLKRADVSRRKDVSRLCLQATHPDEAINKIAVQKLFALVEGHCDSFLPSRIRMYDRLFAQVIDECRRMPGAEEMDRLLNNFGLKDEADLLRRKKKVETIARFPRSFRPGVKKVCILSRVTVGADVAVTGVVISKALEVFPEARIVVIGPQKLSEVFGGHSRISVRDVPYSRRGGLQGRLNAWVGLVGVVEHERRGLAFPEFLVIDPDSRLTQLGLLPVLSQDLGYYFFQSRTYKKAAAHRIGALTACWLDEVFGKGHRKVYPEIFIEPTVLSLGKVCVQGVSHGGARRVVSINFGFGGNDKKRVSADFEEQIVSALLDQGAAVILDKGFGQEVDMMDAIVSRIKARGRTVLEANDQNIAEISRREEWTCDLMTWQGGIAVFGALVGSSNVYIGYDSGFQHIAAAQGVPIIDLFIGAPSARFVKRWTPYSRAPIFVVGGKPGEYACQKERVTLEAVVRAYQKIVSCKS